MTVPSPEGEPEPNSAPARRVGILGGTFDPPHVGHIGSAVWVRSALALDEVWLVVAHRPWQKVGVRPVTPAADRFAMVRAAVAGIDGLRASDVEIARGGDSYLVDTLDELHVAHPATEWYVLLGTDAAAGIPTWQRWHDLAGRATFVLVDRAGVEHAALPDELDFIRVDVPSIELSSTELRARVHDGLAVDGFVPAAVVSVIRDRGLYRGDSV